MKNIAQKSLTFLLFSALYCPINAVANDEPKLEIKTYGFIENYGIISKTGTGKAPLFESGRWYFGFKPKFGIAKGQIELSLTGPSASHKHGNDVTTTTDKITVSGPKKDDQLTGLIGVRRAEAWLAFPTKTEIHLGRLRPGGAIYYGADSMGWFLGGSGFGNVDGASIKQTFTFGTDVSLNLGLTVANTLNNNMPSGSPHKPEYGYAPNGYSNDARWSKSERAIITNAILNAYGFELIGYFGYDPKQIKKVSPVMVASDYMQTEASLAYNYKQKSLMISSWLEVDSDSILNETSFDGGNGKTIVEKEYTSGSVDLNAGSNFVKYGAGFMLSTTFFDINEIIIKDDKLVLGLSIEQDSQNTLGLEGALKEAETGADKIATTASIGYMVNTMETYLGYKNETTSQPIGGHKSLSTTYVKFGWWFE